MTTTERPRELDPVANRLPFQELAQLACAIPGVSGVTIVRGLSGCWMELGRSGNRQDAAAVDLALGSVGRAGPAVDAAAPEALAIAGTAGGVVGALIVIGCDFDRAALKLVASQAAILIESCIVADERAATDRRQRFASRLASRLRTARTPELVVAATIEEVRSELGADSVSFGLVSGGDSVKVETTTGGGGSAATRRVPLAAFGLDGGSREAVRPLTFPSAASATVPVNTDGRLAAILHLQAGAARTWSGPDLALAAEAAEILWRERERALCETELRAGEGRLKAVLESVSDGFYALDADWRFVVFNRAAERFFGMSFHQVAGRKLREVFPEVVRSVLEAHLAHVMATGVAGSIEMRSAARPDRTVEIRASTQVGGGVAVTFTDVTERLVRLGELHSMEARLKALLDRAGAGICETTLDGRFLSTNPRFCEIVGRTEAELLRLDQASITFREDVHPSLEFCRRMISTGEGFTIEKRYVRPAGDAVPVTNAVSLMHGLQGTTALAVIVART